MSQLYRWMIVGSLLVVIGTAGFLVTRSLSGGTESRAQLSPASPEPGKWPPYPPGEGPGHGPSFVDPPANDVTPEPGSTPDTSQPWWWKPWENAERDQPIFEGELAGILIQREPAPTRADVLANEGCEPFYPTPRREARGTALDPEPPWLPANSHPIDDEFDIAIWCGNDVLSARAQWRVPPDQESGLHGAEILVYRYFFDGTPAAMVALPEGRWFQSDVAGFPAAVARPLVENGFGQSAIVFVDGDIVTQVVARGLTVEQLLHIAGGLAR